MQGWWPFKQHAYALHYDIKVTLCKISGRWRVNHQVVLSSTIHAESITLQPI